MKRKITFEAPVPELTGYDKGFDKNRNKTRKTRRAIHRREKQEKFL